LNNCSIILRLFSRSVFPSVYRCFCSTLLIKKPSNYFEGVNMILQLLLQHAGIYYFLSTLSLETVNFLRPFLRRLASTLRPLAVAMRSRNPCTDLRRRLWGWYVRFLFAIFYNFPFTKIFFQILFKPSKITIFCCL
jgi:hypothetical protein